MEKIITSFSGLLWSIFNPLSRGSLHDGGGGLCGYLRNTRLKPFFLQVAWEPPDWQPLMEHAMVSPRHRWLTHRLQLTLHCFCHQAWYSADPLIRTRTLLLFFSLSAQKGKKKNTTEKRHPNRGGGVAEAKPLVSVFIGSWINMAFLIQKSPAVMESEYLSLPPGAGVQWQGRRW